MIAPFSTGGSVAYFPGDRAAGTFPSPCRSYLSDGFGRLPLLLPERDALNLKALCPGPISPFGPGVFISNPGSCPGFSFGSPLLDAGGAGALVATHETPPLLDRGRIS